jgi:hypothetical protein
MAFAGVPFASCKIVVDNFLRLALDVVLLDDGPEASQNLVVNVFYKYHFVEWHEVFRSWTADRDWLLFLDQFEEVIIQVDSYLLLVNLPLKHGETREAVESSRQEIA